MRVRGGESTFIERAITYLEIEVLEKTIREECHLYLFSAPFPIIIM